MITPSNTAPLCAALLALATTLCLPAARADEGRAALPRNAGFTTLATTPLVIEGMTGDNVGSLYAPGRSPGAGVSCPVWRFTLGTPTPVVVANVPTTSPTTQCAPFGLAFGPDGTLFLLDGDRVYGVRPDAAAPPTARLVASGFTGANGLAFDAVGNLWISDGGANQGRVWRIGTNSVVDEVFRVPPLVNAVGVGRTIVGVPASGATIVANGLAFDSAGNLLVADSVRGALWRVRFDSQGRLASPLGCDTTYTANTLCLDNVWVEHPALEGADGIALDRAGNVWVVSNERNALVVALAHGQDPGPVVEVFRNPPDPVTRLRNGGPLEFPTSPVFLGDVFCTANSDGARRDNGPATAGEIGGPAQPRGKITCLDQRVAIPGVPLPVGVRR